MNARSELAEAYWSAVGAREAAIADWSGILGDAQRSSGGRDSPSTLVARNNLATAYRLAGRPDEAMALSERATGQCAR